MVPAKTALIAVALASAMSAAPAAAAPAGSGYRANLVSCALRERACRPDMLRQDDYDYFRHERTSHTRSRDMAERIADSRSQRTVNVKVSEAQLDHWHSRELKFSEFRSTQRALDDGWVPGVNYPYDQPRRASNRPLDAW